MTEIKIKMIKCPTCKGLEKQTIIAKMLTSKGWHNEPPVTVTCILCGGEGEVDPIEMEAIKRIQDNFWCKCKDRDNVRYVNDYEDERCDKHHYRCNHCDKVVQVG